MLILIKAQFLSRSAVAGSIVGPAYLNQLLIIIKMKASGVQTNEMINLTGN